LAEILVSYKCASDKMTGEEKLSAAVKVVSSHKIPNNSWNSRNSGKIPSRDTALAAAPAGAEVVGSYGSTPGTVLFYE